MTFHIRRPEKIYGVKIYKDKYGWFWFDDIDGEEFVVDIDFEDEDSKFWDLEHMKRTAEEFYNLQDALEKCADETSSDT